jgi:2',3'-cyclic-nucleotide 2'-phosphodiesterase
MKILAIGDIFGRPGRQALKELLPGLVREYGVDFVIANGENAAGGRGLTPETTEEIFASGVHVVTAGNHIWEHKSLKPYFDSHPIVRPANTKEQLPGKGWRVLRTKEGVRVGVVCLQGQIFMEEKGPPVSSPFHYIDAVLPDITAASDVIIVDFHAEATSEKRALGFYLDGRVTALVGTHTHVQTADEHVMPKGMAYISDLGMTGPHASVIGLEAGEALHRFLTGDRKAFKVATGGVRLEGVVIDIDVPSKRAVSIRRIQKSL